MVVGRFCSWLLVGKTGGTTAQAVLIFRSKAPVQSMVVGSHLWAGTCGSTVTGKTATCANSIISTAANPGSMHNRHCGRTHTLGNGFNAGFIHVGARDKCRRIGVIAAVRGITSNTIGGRVAGWQAHKKVLVLILLPGR
jgi:hypothetical protein